MYKKFKDLDFITQWMMVLGTSTIIFILLIGFIPKARAEKIEQCDSYCVTVNQVLTEYVHEYKDGTAPIFNEEHTDEFWVEFWDIIIYLVDLKENGII